MANGAKQASEKRDKMREQLWPGSSIRIFDPRNPGIKGYSQVPRVIPLVGRLINELGGPENAGTVYQVLWSHDWGQGIVEIRNFRGLLYEAGYNGKGSRVERTWTERVQILARLGFIDTAANGLDQHGFVLLIDPHLAVMALLSGLVPLDANPKKQLDAWSRQYAISCTHWGIDLDAYRSKLTAQSEPSSEAK